MLLLFVCFSSYIVHILEKTTKAFCVIINNRMNEQTGFMFVRHLLQTTTYIFRLKGGTDSKDKSAETQRLALLPQEV